MNLRIILGRYAALRRGPRMRTADPTCVRGTWGGDPIAWIVAVTGALATLPPKDRAALVAWSTGRGPRPGASVRARAQSVLIQCGALEARKAVQPIDLTCRWTDPGTGSAHRTSAGADDLGSAMARASRVQYHVGVRRGGP